MWSVRNSSSLSLLPPHIFPLLQHGPLLQDTVLQELFQCGSSPWLTVLQEKLLQPGSATGCSYCQKTCFCMGFSPQAPPAGSSSYREPAPVWDLHVLQLPSGHIHLLQRRVLHGLQCAYLLRCGPSWAAEGQPAPPWPSPQAAGECPLQHLNCLFPLHLF